MLFTFLVQHNQKQGFVHQWRSVAIKYLQVSHQIYSLHPHLQAVPQACPGPGSVPTGLLRCSAWPLELPVFGAEMTENFCWPGSVLSSHTGIRRGQDTVHMQWDMDTFLQHQIFVKLHVKYPSYGYSGIPKSKPFYGHLQVLVFFYILSSRHRKEIFKNTAALLRLTQFLAHLFPFSQS